MKPLIPSGAGRLLLPDGRATDELAAEAAQLVRDHLFVVIPGLTNELDEALSFLRKFGPLNEIEVRDKGVLTLDARDDEVLRSKDALPLHKDGLLTNVDARLVGIYCVDFQNVEGGRTYISDWTQAISGIPDAYLTILRENGFEGMAVDDTGYYQKESAKWHHFPAFIVNGDGEVCLHIGLPHKDGETEGWRVRIPGVPEELSDKILRTMIDVFEEKDHTYFHAWSEGDMLLFDNYKVLHGREAYRGGPRLLANIQVLSEGSFG